MINILCRICKSIVLYLCDWNVSEISFIKVTVVCVYCTLDEGLKNKAGTPKYILHKFNKSKLWETCQKRKFKALKNTFKPVKYCYFFFDSQLTGLIQNKTKYCNIKVFYKTQGVYSYNYWNYFQQAYMDKWRSGDFSIQTCCIPLEAFTFKNITHLIYLLDSPLIIIKVLDRIQTKKIRDWNSLTLTHFAVTTLEITCMSSVIVMSVNYMKVICKCSF